MKIQYILPAVMIAAAVTTIYLLRTFSNLTGASLTELDEHEKITYHDETN